MDLLTDPGVWTLSLSVSIGLAALVGGIYLARRRKRRDDTFTPPKFP